LILSKPEDDMCAKDLQSVSSSRLVSILFCVEAKEHPYCHVSLVI
jgi:hypothetical protein